MARQEIIEAILHRYAAAAARATAGGATPPREDAAVWTAVTSAGGRVGAARVRDSAQRSWLVEPHRDEQRGRYVVLRPTRGDNEPFRASADGFRPDAYLPISPGEWTLLALLASGRDGDDGREDEELRHAAFGLVDRMVVEAHHRLLMGAAEDEDDEE